MTSLQRVKRAGEAGLLLTNGLGMIGSREFKMRIRNLVAVTILAGAAPFALAVGQTPAPAPAPDAPVVVGYLAPGQVPQIDRIIPGPPPIGSPRQLLDLETFRNTRQLEASSRWQLARADNDYTVPNLLKTFSCSAGIRLTPANAPKTASLIARALKDTGSTSNGAKQVFQRKRPYLLVDGPICVDKSERLAASPDYPSGHATLSWTIGTILAELMPEHATAILSRARAYSESRVVCGVHTVSAIENGRLTGAITVAAEHGSPEFRADLEAARTELAALRKTADKPDVDQCLVEGALTAKSPF